MIEYRIGWKPKSPDHNIASVRYRCLMPLEHMKEKGVDIELFNEEKLMEYQLVIFSKLYDKKNQDFALELKKNGAKIILDLCDNHFYNPFNLKPYQTARSNILEMLKIADTVVCSTETLAEIVMNEAGLAVRPTVIGDPIELLPSEKAGKASFAGWVRKRFNKKKTPHELPVLLWYGSHGAPNAECGMSDILTIEKILKETYQKHPFKLVVASNNHKKYKKLIEPISIPTDYVEWNYSHFKNLLESATGVILPITNNPFTTCKTNNRLAMALSYGVPVVADGIPSYEEFSEYCYLDDWENGLQNILGDHQSAKTMADFGKEYIKENWMVKNIVNEWEKLVCSL